VARGIEATPGVVHQALCDLSRARRDGPVEGGPAAGALSPKDVEAVRSLAEKAGGAKCLMRFLRAMQRVAL
jgi:hypothetical protein